MAGQPAAVVFPGQGAQKRGMGADFHDQFGVARAVFEEASEAVGEDLRDICFGEDDRLHLTEYTQPCILTMEIAAYRVAAEEFGLAPGLFGGHSLGEYTALVVAGVIPFADALRLVRIRGALMQQVVPTGRGAMAALIMDDIADSGVVPIVEAAGAEVANHNSTMQIVISGTTESIAAAKGELETALPDLTFVPLKVSAPSHTALMRPAEPVLRAHLERCLPRMRPERAAVVTSNYTGGFHSPEMLIEHLARQIAAPVRWLDNMRELSARAQRIYEVGPRDSLTKFFATLGVTATPVTQVSEALDSLGAQSASRPREVRPEWLGSGGFRRDHDVRLACAADGDGLEGAGPEMVIRLGKAGLLSYLNTDLADFDQVVGAVERVRSVLGSGAPWGVSVAHGSSDPGRADRLIRLFDELDVPSIEVSGLRQPLPSLVRYRLAGRPPEANGGPARPRRVLVKVSSVDDAAAWLDGPAVVGAASRAAGNGGPAWVPGSAVADDICVTAGIDLLAAVVRLRDERGPSARVGLAGELGTAEAVAAAFAAGADFVVMGSVNRCTAEAELGETIKDLLAASGPDDFSAAPSLSDFEIGGQVQVLAKGTLFAVRARHLYETFVRYGSVEEVPDGIKERIERHYLRRGFDELWHEITATRESAGSGANGREKMAALFRWYLADTLSRTDDPLNLQVRGDAAVGWLNQALRGSPLENWRDRHADEVIRFLMKGAAAVTEAHLHRFITAESSGIAS